MRNETWFEEEFSLVPPRIDPATCTSKSIIKIHRHISTLPFSCHVQVGGVGTLSVASI